MPLYFATPNTSLTAILTYSSLVGQWKLHGMFLSSGDLQFVEAPSLWEATIQQVCMQSAIYLGMQSCMLLYAALSLSIATSVPNYTISHWGCTVNIESHWCSTCVWSEKTEACGVYSQTCCFQCWRLVDRASLHKFRIHTTSSILQRTCGELFIMAMKQNVNSISGIMPWWTLD